MKVHTRDFYLSDIATFYVCCKTAKSASHSNFQKAKGSKCTNCIRQVYSNLKIGKCHFCFPRFLRHKFLGGRQKIKLLLESGFQTFRDLAKLTSSFWLECDLIEMLLPLAIALDRDTELRKARGETKLTIKLNQLHEVSNLWNEHHV